MINICPIRYCFENINCYIFILTLWTFHFRLGSKSSCDRLIVHPFQKCIYHQFINTSLLHQQFVWLYPSSEFSSESPFPIQLMSLMWLIILFLKGFHFQYEKNRSCPQEFPFSFWYFNIHDNKSLRVLLNAWPSLSCLMV